MRRLWVEQILLMGYDGTGTAVIGMWFVMFGGCIGSFLNVAVYRLPAGKSLLYPPSHCPQCGHPIRWFDNVPVFGWLILCGKCRDCRRPIPIRYPLTEALCGLLAGGIFLLCTGIFTGTSVIVPVSAALIVIVSLTLLFVVRLLFLHKNRRP